MLKIEDELMLAPGFAAQPNLDYLGYHQYIEEKLPPESPTLYGLHPNAEIEFLTMTSNTLFRTLLEMQPRNALHSETLGQSTDEKVGHSFLWKHNNSVVAVKWIHLHKTTFVYNRQIIITLLHQNRNISIPLESYTWWLLVSTSLHPLEQYRHIGFMFEFMYTYDFTSCTCICLAPFAPHHRCEAHS